MCLGKDKGQCWEVGGREKGAKFMDSYIWGKHHAERLVYIISFHLYNIPVRGIFYLHLKNEETEILKTELAKGRTGIYNQVSQVLYQLEIFWLQVTENPNQTVVNQKRYVIVWKR